uniref:sensor histidine kinase N-terminal domain-containing protein n=1 Tax=Rivihabitans pingtungensis TaxID=1054498 RepID=UPI00289F7D7B
MRRRPASLRGRILLWLLAPLGAMTLVSAWLTYHNAHTLANQAYDRTLQASVRAIAERVRVSDGQALVDIPLAALEMFEPQFQDRVFYRVSLPRGRVLTGYADLPAPPPSPRGEIFYFDGVYHGEAVRFAAFYQPLYDPVAKGPVLVQVGETLNSRQQLTRRIVWDALGWRLLLALLACLA